MMTFDREKLRLETYEQRQDFLTNALQGENSAYALITCKGIDSKLVTFPVLFNKIKVRPPRQGYRYLADAVELQSHDLNNHLYVLNSTGRLKAITYKEAAENCENYYIRNNHVYELEARTQENFLPEEIEVIRLISEEECVDWIIENCL